MGEQSRKDLKNDSTDNCVVIPLHNYVRIYGSNLNGMFVFIPVVFDSFGYSDGTSQRRLF